MRVPLGVFGMIYESRPNVTIEAASLAIKSGNACILRGGSEAIRSNRALVALVQAGARRRRPAARRGAAGADHRPRRGRPPDRVARVGRRDHPARRQGTDRAHRRAKRKVPVHQAPRRQLPRLRRRRAPTSTWRSPSSTTPRRRSTSPCNAAESLLVHAAIARGVPAAHRARVRGQGRRDALRRRAARRCCPAHGRRGHRRHRGRLGPGVPRRRSSASRSSTRSTRRSRTSTATARTTPTPSSPSNHAARDALPARGRLGERDGQRVDPLRRRLRVRPRRRDRHLAPTSCTPAARSASRA